LEEFLAAARRRTLLWRPFICGSPETVIDQIKKIARQAGADAFLGEFTFGELTQKQALNSLKLFTEEVLPELRKFEIDALSFPKAET
jgi:alkanesulfonate monooxygenase SsuD/methylene tetrahydromethanopterin reductase-like flavin-dependent oxidoreductase (luciferase family)